MRSLAGIWVLLKDGNPRARRALGLGTETPQQVKERVRERRRDFRHAIDSLFGKPQFGGPQFDPDKGVLADLSALNPFRGG